MRWGERWGRRSVERWVERWGRRWGCWWGVERERRESRGEAWVEVGGRWGAV